ARTKNHIVLEDAYNEGKYRDDKVIKENKTVSVLCAPVTNKGNLSAIIYLENNTIKSAFTNERIEILQIIASQAAISIENASLYNNLENRVKKRTKEIGDIMDNVEQGIFTINPDLTVNPEYSKKVIDIFARNNFGGKKFTSIFPSQLTRKIEIFLVQLFKNKFMSEKMFQSINPLRSYKLILEKNKSKHLSFHFSRIRKEDENGNPTKEIDKLMAVIDDKTEEYELQQQLEAKAKEQANKVEKLYQIINLDPAIFSGFLKEGSEIISIVHGKLSGNIEKLKDAKNIEEAYRAVHTLKGNARALNLDSIGDVCHKLEDELDKVRNDILRVDEKLYKLVQESINHISLELQDGNSLFDKIFGMKSALQDKVSSPIASLESILRGIFKKESEEQNKTVDFSFKAEVSESITEEKLKILKNPLLQIVRNAIGHGLEETENRKQLGKPETGKVSIGLQTKNDVLIAICEDDGRGLDAERLRQKAIEKNLLTTLEADTLSDEDCYAIVFRAGFSTAEKVTGTSGRGIGMDIVKQEIEQAKGTIKIETEVGKFTRFIIAL
ncbi:MAG: ATP-binding protein, partial [Spirochaetota bacterium]